MDGERKCNSDKKFDRIMPNACKYFIKIVYDGQGALIVVSLLINLQLVLFNHFDHSPVRCIQIFAILCSGNVVQLSDFCAVETGEEEHSTVNS